ncbi:MAG: 2-C-methyl-D-erythritol 2,4-cyclodiphosphate synthase [Chloroflexi bacterium RBG_16_57_8]|nr:MAG: 2-C-methyl-D-erythritol 2,4-cyclodiphosphate synthase [Chloroflexi bacterium RBG_16_57_8]
MAGKQRVGIGHDVHRLVPGRRLVLGGVEIPYEKGLEGWSDADALIHAIIDALLGAAGMGDIGRHFPAGVEEYRNISSLVLLRRVADKLKENGWRVGNVDATVIAEEPRLSGHIDRMRQRMSEALGIAPEQVNVKACTSEGLGFTGRKEGIETLAVAMIEEPRGESQDEDN